MKRNETKYSAVRIVKSVSCREQQNPGIENMYIIIII